MPVSVEGDHINIHLSKLPKGKHSLRVEALDESGARVVREGPVWIEDIPFSLV